MNPLDGLGRLGLEGLGELVGIPIGGGAHGVHGAEGRGQKRSDVHLEMDEERPRGIEDATAVRTAGEGQSTAARVMIEEQKLSGQAACHVFSTNVPAFPT